MPDKTKAPVLHCPTCYSTRFQISRPRPEDRLQLWLFKHPVRCRKCNARIYASRSYVRWLRKEGDRESSLASVKADLASPGVAD